MTGPASRVVTVVGAGISGLTVAHELAVRGFRVQIVEPATIPTARGAQCLAVGGLARSHYSRIPRHPTREELDGAASRRGTMTSTTPLSFPSVTSLAFTPEGISLTAEGRSTLERLVTALRGSLLRYRFSVRIGPSTGVQDDPALAPARIALVRRLLVEGGIDEHRMCASSATAAEAKAIDCDPCLPSVEVVLDDAIAPGEHGFRFIPALYRHFNDTLSRIPLYDDLGHQTHRSVRDRLVPVETHLLFPIRARAAELDRGRGAALGGLARAFTELGCSPRDSAFLFLRMLRFATTGERRRTAEYEDLTWWDFCTRKRLESQENGTFGEPSRFDYSPRFLEYLRHSPRALVAMDAEHCDARTQGSIYLQMARDQLLPGGLIDAVLDAPTTEALLVPWKAHLEALGVTFFSGQLSGIHTGGPQPPSIEAEFELAPHDGASFEQQADYVVIATDLIAAERLARPIREWGRAQSVDVGVFQDLEAFALEVPEAPDGRVSHRRDPETETGVTPWDRLQTLSGAQYFFGHRVGLTKGFGYFLDSEWALTSLTHTEHWRVPRVLSRDGYLSVISIDIGDVRMKSHTTGRCIWDSSRDEVARETWRQIDEAAGGASRTSRLPEPLYYSVDEGLEFGPSGLLRNRTPFLINVVGDWRRRPGPEPFDPHDPIAPPSRRESAVVWQAPHGGYLVHFGRVVFAGTYLRTFTRLTTMEAANESARHAVNAILDHLGHRLGVASGLASSVHAPSAPVPSGVGDYCPIFQLERHEFPALEFLKKLDDELFTRKLPHLADLLDVDGLPESVDPSDREPLLGLVLEVCRRLEAHIDLSTSAERELLARALDVIRELF